MNRQFAVSVRAIPLCAIAASAIAGGLLKDWPTAALMALQFALFAVWPERLAFAYRAVARWTRLTSVTTPAPSGGRAETFADYDPKVADLFRAYALHAVWTWVVAKPRPAAGLTVLGILLVGGLALWRHGRST